MGYWLEMLQRYEMAIGQFGKVSGLGGDGQFRAKGKRGDCPTFDIGQFIGVAGKSGDFMGHGFGGGQMVKADIAAIAVCGGLAKGEIVLPLDHQNPGTTQKLAIKPAIS